MKQLVKGASLIRCGGLGYAVRQCGYKSSGAPVFRARQLAAWREVTGRVTPATVAIAVNGREYTSESDARKAIAGKEVSA